MVDTKYIAAAVIGIVVIVGAALFLTGTSTTVKGASESYTVAAAVNKDCAGTTWLVGQQKGFFNKSGINFVDKGHIDWSQQPSSLIAGQTNVYDGHPNTIINLIKSGAKVKAVVATGDEPAEGRVDAYHMHYLVKEDSPLKTAADIKTFKEKNGRKVKIAVGAEGLCVDLQLKAWLRNNGLSKDDIELIVLPDPKQYQALLQGEIDVAGLHPPFYTAAKSNGGVRTFFTSYDAFGEEAGLGLLVFTEDFIKNQPDTVRKFINGYKDAQRWVNQNRDESAIITGKYIGLNNSTVHYYSDSGKIEDAAIQKWIDAMVADGELQPGEIKASDLYTTEFSDTWK